MHFILLHSKRGKQKMKKKSHYISGILGTYKGYLMMKKALIKYILVLVNFIPVNSIAQESNAITVIAYYPGDTAQISKYDPQKLTHIIFSFTHLKGNQLSVDNATDTLTIKRLVAMKKQNSYLKVMLALGGWGGCKTCSDIFSTGKDRQEFANSVKSLNDYFNTDGIDLDWEYPAIEGYPGHKHKTEDKKNFTALVKQLRETLGEKQEISFAAGGFKKFLDEAIEWEPVMRFMDRVNLMSYDLVHGYSKQTGHHTPLYSTPEQTESTDNAVKNLIKMGVPPNKIVIGAAFYGRMWEDVPVEKNGLYQKGKFKSSIAFKDFDSTLSVQKGFVYYWDSTANAPFLYNTREKLFITYDDEKSIRLKTRYVVDNKLQGIMFWHLGQDKKTNGLLEVIDKEKPKTQLNRKNVSPPYNPNKQNGN